MKSKITDIVIDGINFNIKQIAKLEAEIQLFSKNKLKKNIKPSVIESIDHIIQHDKNLIKDYEAEITNLKKRL